MTGALITTVTIDDREIMATLERLASRGDNLSGPMGEIAEIMGQSSRERFATGLDPDGKPWAPLAPSTIASKTRRRRPLDILVDGGQLRQIVQRATPTEAMAGTNRVYGAAQHFGAEIQRYAQSRVMKVTAKGRFARNSSKAKGRRQITIGDHTITIPSRRFLGISADDRMRILEVLTDHLVGDAA